MLTLGLSGNFSGVYSDIARGTGAGFFHDSAAALIRDGEVLVAVEEERFNRIKKTTKFPLNAIGACFDAAGVNPSELDHVGYYFGEEVIDFSLDELYLRNIEAPVRSARQLIQDHLRASFDVRLPAEQILFAPHHDSHAMSALVHSGMAEALVVVMDGRGEDRSTTIYHSAGTELTELASHGISKSLGSFYASAIRLLGYGLGDEYKIMGLAPYGNREVFADYFNGRYRLKDNGEFSLGSIVLNRIGGGFQPRRKGQDFTQQHADFAAGIQATLEAIALHVIGYWQQQTSLANLCFSGGVAHNSTLNGLLATSGLFDEIFVHPASHDAGAAEGAGFLAELAADGTAQVERLRSAYLGPGLGSTDVVKAELDSWSELIEVAEPANLIGTVAESLAAGEVAGWSQGRSEFGPRALGNRSILADPRPESNRDRINAMIKQRESYRPFAPAVIEEAADKYFELPLTRANYDFMSFVVGVRAEQRETLGAVTHVDGSARVQVVNRDVNPLFHGLIEEFGRLTGMPVLLNTSFNNNAEPIVQTVRDAIVCFLTTGLDLLVVDRFVIRRRPELLAAIDGLVPRLPPMARLTRTRKPEPDGSYTDDCELFLDVAKGDRVRLSQSLHALLGRLDGATSIAELSSGRTELDPAIRAEVFELWQRRLITLQPPAASSR